MQWLNIIIFPKITAQKHKMPDTKRLSTLSRKNRKNAHKDNANENVAQLWALALLNIEERIKEDVPEPVMTRMTHKRIEKNGRTNQTKRHNAHYVNLVTMHKSLCQPCVGGVSHFSARFRALQISRCIHAIRM